MTPGIVDRFVAAGFSEPSAIRKAQLLATCTNALGRPAPTHILYVPGRVEVMGKHTDYAGGRSLTCAIDRGFVLAVRLRSDSHCMAYACDLRQSAGFDLAADLRPPESGWNNYVLSVARRVSRNFGAPLKGVDFAFASDLPQASGLSSSSALIIASYLAIDCANDFAARPQYQQNITSHEDLAGYLGTCENGQSFGKLAGDRGVGTFGGSEDHTAILCSRRGQLSMYTYNPVRLERRIDMPEELSLVIGSSGVVAEKTAAARDLYNRVSLTASAVMESLRAAGWTKPTLAATIGDDRNAAQCIDHLLSDARHPRFTRNDLLLRFRQFAAEHQVLAPALADALVHRDWLALGKAADQSQWLAETNLRNQVPETVALARTARQLGAHAASAFGAGFGGSVWAMVNRSDAPAFLEAWQSAYKDAFPQQASASAFFVTEPVGGAMRI